MASPLFHFQHRVTYAECTLANHVYYARYLEWLEAARGEFFRSLGHSFWHWQQQGVAFPVVECRLRYLVPAQYDDLLTVEVTVAELERVRLSFGYRVMNQDGREVLRGTTVHACTNPRGQLQRIPLDLAHALGDSATGAGRQSQS